MNAPHPRELERRVADLRDLAEGIAASMASLRQAVTPATERAALRLIGVQGLDAHGRPLAAAVVERLTELGKEGFAAGVALPLAGAAIERDLAPQEVALDVAAGRLDLAAEAERLRRPGARAEAKALVGAWSAEAFERIDANRTARHELNDALGEHERPWLGAYLGEPLVKGAAAEARGLIAAGADLLVVRVPPSRELVLGTGRNVDETLPPDAEPPPTGSQRGLAELRAAADEAAAERGAYVRLATATEGLAAPEQALVAAFERVDFVFADPLDEIALGLEPERAFADHAAAHEFVRRSGATLVLGAGPLLAGPELVHGESVGAQTRIGRSIAAQALSAAWARASGLAPEQIVVQVPFELPESISAARRLLAETGSRRLLHPEYAMVVSEPADAGTQAAQLGLPLCLLAGGETSAVIRRGDASEFSSRAADTRAAVALARTLASTFGASRVGGALSSGDEVASTAVGLIETAIETLRTVTAEGWSTLIGAAGAIAGREAARLGGSAVVPRRGYVGPFEDGRA